MDDRRFCTSGNNDRFHIKGVHYKATPDLCNFMLMKDPKEDVYSEDELIVYKSMVTATNAHRRNHLPSPLLKSNKGEKCRVII